MRNDDKLVSVIIATYNRAGLIERSLKSVLAQTYKNIEIVVIDDCSNDNTTDVLERYTSQFENFKYVTNSTNRGIAYNSNLGFSLCNGAYIALLGDDDEWIDRNKIANQVEFLKSNPSYGLVTTEWQDIKSCKVIFCHKPETKDLKSKILVGNGIFCGSTALISRAAWLEVGGFDESVPRGCDSDLFRSIVFKDFGTHVLQGISTNVYIDDHPRMTPTDSAVAIEKDITSNLRCLQKFSEEFDKNFEAKKTRVNKVAKKNLKLAFRTKSITPLLNSIKILWSFYYRLGKN